VNIKVIKNNELISIRPNDKKKNEQNRTFFQTKMKQTNTHKKSNKTRGSEIHCICGSAMKIHTKI